MPERKERSIKDPDLYFLIKMKDLRIPRHSQMCTLGFTRGKKNDILISQRNLNSKILITEIPLSHLGSL